jgi:hypothetical protein
MFHVLDFVFRDKSSIGVTERVVVILRLVPRGTPLLREAGIKTHNDIGAAGTNRH